MIYIRNKRVVQRAGVADRSDGLAALGFTQTLGRVGSSRKLKPYHSNIVLFSPLSVLFNGIRICDKTCLFK